MKKSVLGLIFVLSLSTILVQAYADPDYGLIKANKRKHIVRNYLIDSFGEVSGYVVFACQSVEGFQYSVSVKGLQPSTTYNVRAESMALVYLPPPDDTWVPTSDGGGNTYILGSIITDGDGEGEVSGLYTLSASHLFLPFGLYGWEIKVAPQVGADMLWTIPPVGEDHGDPIDFQVFPSW